jgi:hypothetical protein
MSETKIPEDIAALARKIGKQFKSEQYLLVFTACWIFWKSIGTQYQSE